MCVFRRTTKRGKHVPYRVARQTPENIPLLLVANRGASNRDGVCVNNGREPREARVLGVDGARESEVARCVLVSDVRDCVVGERRAHQLECGVHLRTDAFKEHTATTDEERIPREDYTCIRRRRVGHVVTDRIARMARRRETPGNIVNTLPVSARDKRKQTSRRALCQR